MTPVLTGRPGRPAASTREPQIVACITLLIDAETEAGHFAPAIPSDVLAYALVRLGEAFTYNDALVGIRGDSERLRQVAAALLGVDER
jgi:hypothetical protein